MSKVLGLTLILFTINGLQAFAQFQEALNLTKRGLNYVQVSHKLGQRISPSRGPLAGLTQPATFSVSGIPAGAVIEKAFIWTGSSGTAASITVNINTPGSQNVSVPMVKIGNGVDKCWGYAGTSTYRADITSVVEGNGVYNLSGLPVGFPNEVDGATLMVIYSEPTAAFIGTCVIADGIFTIQGGGANHSINNFSAPQNAVSAKAFSIISDLEVPSTIVNLNGNVAPELFDWWNFFEINTTVTTGQSTSNFSVYATGDCYTWIASGLYYQVAAPLTIAINENSISNRFCTGAALNLAFTATGTFLPGNEFTAQLSDAAGNFSSPVTIGTLAGTGSGTINATIPANTVPGSGYRVRLVSSNPALNSAANSTNLAISGLPVPEIITSFIYPSQINQANSKVIFLGHGNQQMQLNASNKAGGATTFEWKQIPGLDPTKLNSPNLVFSPTTEGNYTINLKATNTNGCSTTILETITVIDAVCGNKGDKVMVCHNGKEICVAANAVATLQNQPGSVVGPCNPVLPNISRTANPNNSNLVPETSLKAYPNPFGTNAKIEYTLAVDGAYRAEVLDMKGQLVKVIASEEGAAGKLYSKELSSNNLAAGMYLVRLVSASEVKYLKLMLDK